MENRPTHAFLRINNLMGFFRDCGCTGGESGGLARIIPQFPSAESPCIILTGWTVLSPSELDWSNEERMKIVAAQVRARISIFRALLNELNGVVWVAMPEEVAALEQLGAFDGGLSEYIRESGEELGDGTLGVQADDEGRVLLGDGFMAAKTPEAAADRGRRAQIGLVWLDSRKPLRVDTVASAALARRSAEPGRWLSFCQSFSPNQELSSVALAAISTKSEDPASARIEKIVGSYDLAIAHTVPRSAHDGLSQNTTTTYDTCQACHTHRVEAWKNSGHAHAMNTLVSIGRASDHRCLACHTTEIPIVDGLDPGVATVGCGSCHGAGQKEPKDRCVSCHTYMSDPRSVYKSRLSDICGSKKASPIAGDCGRID